MTQYMTRKTRKIALIGRQREEMSCYYNAVGQRFELPERALEPPDCWDEEPGEPKEEEYDRAEDEMNGIFNRRGTHGSKDTC